MCLKVREMRTSRFATCALQPNGIKIRLPIGQLDDKIKEKQNLFESFKQKLEINLKILQMLQFHRNVILRKKWGF